MKTVRKIASNHKENSFESSKYLNLPDLQFYQWCNHHYMINRGVYNTIDQWFFDYGIINIHHRRIQILGFLEFVKPNHIGQNQNKFIRFGHEGLKKRLYDFIKTGQMQN
ncbi:hypothetical protein HPT25_17530 [Bacillus sp. BRMEA1]|uniref:hypothetical protein n=1 Tax=Neobacillus endophyticus TaxID=2738405 RepID=UPI0015646741|nr:hypothetical protein [Neobacillus endophyticus]NRD79162.1 hypothetical protein [Neobacillus endophyticus]